MATEKFKVAILDDFEKLADTVAGYVELERGFRAPGVPLLPIAAIVACVWLMLNLTGLTWIRFLIWMAIGVLVYFAYGRRHSVLASREAAISA